MYLKLDKPAWRTEHGKQSSSLKDPSPGGTENKTVERMIPNTHEPRKRSCQKHGP